MVITQQIILVLIPLIVPYIIMHAIVWGTALYHQVLAKLPVNQRAALQGFAIDAVTAAEKKLHGMSGAEKKKSAETALFAFCQHFKIPVPNTTIVDALIEAAVATLPKALAAIESEDTTKQVSLPSAKS